jgi:alkylation response protein AidB-like acyl-CoA dehydrogenase
VPTPGATKPARSFDSTEAAALREEAREWLEDALVGQPRLDPDLPDAEYHQVRIGWDKKLFAGGYSALSWPAEYGGAGLGAIEDFIFAEEAWRQGAPEGLAGRVGRLLVGPCLMVSGNPEQNARFLPSIVAAETIWCQGFSEPDAGSDLASLRTSARQDGDTFVVSGQKIWSSFSAFADWCLLLTRTGDPKDRHHNLTMLLMPLHQKGVEVRPIRQISGGSEFSEIFLDNAVTTADCVLGEVNEGWRVALNTLSVERGVGFTAVSLGSAGQEIDGLESCDDCRRNLGAAGPQTLSDLRSRLAAVRWQSIRSIEYMAAGTGWNRSHSVLKIAMSELSQAISRVGAEHSCAAHFGHWRNRYFGTRSASIASGTNEINRNVMADRVLGLPR